MFETVMEDKPEEESTFTSKAFGLWVRLAAGRTSKAALPLVLFLREGRKGLICLLLPQGLSVMQAEAAGAVSFGRSPLSWAPESALQCLQCWCEQQQCFLPPPPIERGAVRSCQGLTSCSGATIGVTANYSWLYCIYCFCNSCFPSELL